MQIVIKASNFEYKYFNICRIILDQDPLGFCLQQALIVDLNI